MKTIEKIALPLATGFGLGFSPVASGTAGTLPGVLIVWVLWTWSQQNLAIQIAAAILLALCAIPICDIAERVFGKKDDGRIVADEYLTFPICMLGLPCEPWVLAIAFVSNRFFDILKPFPARRLQAIKGGLGIVIDDVFATLYSLAFNHAAYWVLNRYLTSGACP